MDFVYFCNINFSSEKKFFQMNLSRTDLFQQQAFIDGKFVDAVSQKSFPVYNPYSGD